MTAMMLAGAVLLVATAAPQARAQTPCGADLPERGRQTLQAQGYQVVLSPQVWPIPVGRHFGVDIAICPTAGQAMPQTVRVDADMPAHRHGMNYRATVQPASGGQAGRHTAQGLMFHMPGQWRFIVDLSGTAGTVRATRDITVQ